MIREPEPSRPYQSSGPATMSTYKTYHRTGRLETTGTIVEVGRNRRYLVRKSNGRLVWRNRRHLRKPHPLMTPSKIYPANNLGPATLTETPSSSRHIQPHLVPTTDLPNLTHQTSATWELPSLPTALYTVHNLPEKF